MNPRSVAGLLALLSVLVGSAAGADPAPVPLRLHPELPQVIEGELLDRLALFPDVPDLRRVTFQRAVWGGVIARLETASRVLERHLPAHRWQALRERAALVMAGRPLPPAPAVVPIDTLAPPRVWPEGPPPPAAVPAAVKQTGITPLAGRWLAVVEAGARVDVTGFNEFFGPMGQIGIAFGYGVTSAIVPQLGFYAGFGNMRADLEDAFGDGRTNGFGFTFNTLLRAQLGRRHSLYAEGGGGYHIRSLYWGNAFLDPGTGRVYEGRVIEQRDFGWNARVGWLLARAGGNRPRLLDVGIGVHSMPADQWFYTTPTAMFEASHRDTWLMLTVRIWDGL
ncbi:MAG: hypothetical protein R3D98_10255 [Candidatus Krumholzibacteriia bacterium]